MVFRKKSSGPQEPPCRAVQDTGPRPNWGLGLGLKGRAFLCGTHYPSPHTHCVSQRQVGSISDCGRDLHEFGHGWGPCGTIVGREGGRGMLVGKKNWVGL